MTEYESHSPTAESWDAYWQGSRHGAAFTGGGTSHPLVFGFWAEVFGAARQQYDSPRIIDIASGSGAVVESAKSAFGGTLAEFTCIDISAAAIGALMQRFPGVEGIVADARRIPIESSSFDIAASQFGVEYAGPEAIDELARLISPRGQVILLLHHRFGGIYRQCAASLDAIERMQQCEFIPLAAAMLEQGFAVSRGANRSRYDAAARRLGPAIRSMESIMAQYGQHVADGTIVRLYKDVRTIQSRIANYEAAEVLEWLRKLQGEVQAYAGRMASMCAAAIDADAFQQMCDKLRNQGFVVLRGEPLAIPGRDVPLAWVLQAQKP